MLMWNENREHVLLISLAISSACLAVFVALFWAALKYVRGGVSTGASKRAVTFGTLVCAENVVSIGAASFGHLHMIGASAVSVAAVWVWMKAKGMRGIARTSANLIIFLTLLSLSLGIVISLRTVPAVSTLHGMAGLALLLAAVWHAYELRIYPAD